MRNNTKKAISILLMIGALVVGISAVQLEIYIWNLGDTLPDNQWLIMHICVYMLILISMAFVERALLIKCKLDEANRQ